MREPTNPFDPNAIAVRAFAPGSPTAAYISKGHAKRLRKILDAGTELTTITTYGTPPGEPCLRIAVIAAAPPSCPGSCRATPLTPTSHLPSLVMGLRRGVPRRQGTAPHFGGLMRPCSGGPLPRRCCCVG